MAVTLVPVSALSEADVAAMRMLLDRHFVGVDVQVFSADLAEKSHVVRLHGADGALVGFSTIGYRRRADLGGAVVISGDTIVDPAAWAEVSLGAAWVAAVLDVHAASGGGCLWWLLLTSGVRTYRYLTRCLRRYAPAARAERCDEDALALLPTLARDCYGDQYDPMTGVVRLPRPQMLRTHLAELPAHALGEDERLFVQRNPGHLAGDELVSLCRLAEDNLTRTGLLSLRRGRELVTGPAS